MFKEDNYKSLIETCPEVGLYLIINEIGGYLWHMNHGLSHGRIEDPTGSIVESFPKCREQQIQAVKQLQDRFGVPALESDGETPTESYWKWFRWWDGYIKGLNDVEWKKLNDACAAHYKGEDVSLDEWRPEGEWQNHSGKFGDTYGQAVNSGENENK